jgi:hypothetical protein
MKIIPSFHLLQEHASLFLIVILLSIIIVIFIPTINKQTKPNLYYVSKNESGNGSGSSWANSTNSISALNWSSIHGGDTIFVDGGSDSLTYNPVVLNGLTPSGVVVITKGRDSSHNGKVIFSPSSSGDTVYPLRITGCNNIKFTGLTIKWELGTKGGGILLLIGGSTNINADNCHIISNGVGGYCVVIDGSTHISLTNNIIESTSNSSSQDQDGITVGNGGGGHTFTGNTIILRGTNPTPHIDCLQWWGNEGSTNGYQTIIADNFMYLAPNPIVGNQEAIYLNAIGSNRFLIYNNVITSIMTQMCPLTINQTSPYHVSAQIYNNTIISKDQHTFETTGMDTLIFKNNICVIDSSRSTQVMALINGLGAFTYMVFDYNQYYEKGQTTRIYTGTSSSSTFQQWIALGYDTHSDNGSFSFSNIWGTNITDYSLTTGSAGINTGTDLSTYFTTDILGTPRLQGAEWDKGALVFK